MIVATLLSSHRVSSPITYIIQFQKYTDRHTHKSLLNLVTFQICCFNNLSVEASYVLECSSGHLCQFKLQE